MSLCIFLLHIFEVCVINNVKCLVNDCLQDVINNVKCLVNDCLQDEQLLVHALAGFSQKPL